jgi:hypothetical protein
MCPSLDRSKYELLHTAECRITLYIFGKGGGEPCRFQVCLCWSYTLVQGICGIGRYWQPEAINADAVVGKPLKKLAVSLMEQFDRRNKFQTPTQVVEMQSMLPCKLMTVLIKYYLSI